MLLSLIALLTGSNHHYMRSLYPCDDATAHSARGSDTRHQERVFGCQCELWRHARARAAWEAGMPSRGVLRHPAPSHRVAQGVLSAFARA